VSERDELLALYARLGLATIPLLPRSKRPLRAGWKQAPSQAWLGAPLDANVGIVCGSISGGLVVLDFDEQDGPRETLCMTPRELAVHTIVVATHRGYHVYARHVGFGASVRPRAGLDVQGEGALVVAPPSIHPSGGSYGFVAEPRRIAALAEITVVGDLFKSTAAGAEARVAEPTDETASVTVDWETVEEWIGVQSPKLREAWTMLRAGETPDEFDRSKADFAVARCLWEGGWSEADVAAVLMGLVGSKARERGERYALRTALRARR